MTRLPLLAAVILALPVGVATSAEPAPPPAADQPPEPPPITWDAYIAEIERTNPLMDAAKAGLDVFAQKLKQADWAYFPSIKLDAGIVPIPKAETDSNNNTTIDWSSWGVFYQVKLTIVQPLYTFGKIASLQRAAKHGRAAGRAAVDLARWELRYRAAGAWYGRLLAEELKGIIKDGEKWLDKATKNQEKMRDEDADDYDQSEHMRLNTRVADFEVLATQNAEIMRVSSDGMRLLLGRPPGNIPKPAVNELAPIAIELQPVERYVALARKAPGLDLARNERDARRALASNKDAELWPDIVFIGEVRLEDNTFDEDLTSGSSLIDEFPVTGLIGMRWNLDIPRRIHIAKEAWAEARKSAKTLEVKERLSELEVRQTYQQLLNKQKLVDVFRKSQKAAQGWMQGNWDLYDAGFGNFRDVMDALVQFYSKKAGYLQQVHEFNLLVFKLSQAIGVDITTLTTAEADKAALP